MPEVDSNIESNQESIHEFMRSTQEKADTFDFDEKQKQQRKISETFKWINHNPSKDLKASHDKSLQNNSERSKRIVQAQLKTAIETSILEKEDNLERIEAEIAREDFDERKYTSDHPIVAKYYADNPHRMAISPIDLDNMGFFERAYKALGTGFTKGVKTQELGRAGFEQLRGRGTPEIQEEIERLNKEVLLTPGGDSFASEWIFPAATFVGNMFDSVSESVDEIVGGAIGGATFAVAGPQALAAPITVPTGIITGAGIGLTVGLAKETFIVESGHAYLDLARIRNEAGEGIDEDIVKAGAVFQGTVNAAFEMIGLKLATAPVKGLFKKFIREETANFVKDRTLSRALKTFGSNYAKAIVGEVSTEVAQEGTGIFTEEVAKLIADPDFENIMESPELRQEAYERLVGTMSETFRGMALLGFPGAAGNLMIDSRRALKSRAIREQVGDKMAETEIIELDPQGTEELLQSINENEESEFVYVPTGAMENYAKALGVTPAEAAAQILGDPKEYVESVNTGRDMQMTKARYDMTISKDPEIRSFFQDEYREGLSDMNAREAEEFLKNFAGPDIEKLNVQVENEDAAKEVAENVSSQLKAIGFDEKIADDNSRIYEAVARTLAHRSGKTVEEIFAPLGLSITRPDIEGLEAKTPNTVMNGVFERNLQEQQVEDVKDATIEQANIDLESGKITQEQHVEIVETSEKQVQDSKVELDQVIDDGGVTLEQASKSPLGRIILKDNKARIELFQDANLSTFLHETGHLYLEILGNLAEDVNATEEIKADHAAALKWLGVKSRKGIKTKHHEKWARGFEAYLRDGKAPTPELQSLFDTFKSWLERVYKHLMELRVVLSPEIRGVMDRLVATDEEIDSAQAQQSQAALFPNPIESGMNEKDLVKYRKVVEEGRQVAEADVIKKFVAENDRKQTKKWKADRKKVKQEVTDEVNDRPAYIAASVMGRGKMPDGSELVDFEPFKMSKKIIVAEHGKEILKELPRPFVYTTKEDGVHPETAAQLFGFKTASEMLASLSALEKKSDVIDTITDERMKEEFGDLLTDGQLTDEAMEAIHNDKNSKRIQMELKHLASQEFATFKKLVRRISTRIPTVKAIREQARRAMLDKNFRTIKPIAYQRAEARAARESIEAMLNSDYDAAFEAKRKELINHEYFREAVKARETIEKGVKFVSKFKTKKVRQRIGKTGQSYLEQIDTILERFDFKKNVSQKAAIERMALTDWIQEQQELGYEPVLSPAVLNEAFKQNFKDVPYQELLGIFDSVKNIDHLSRLKESLLSSKEKRDFNEAVETLVESINENVKKKPKKKLEKGLPIDAPGEFISAWASSHRKFSSLTRQMDGFEDNGAAWELMTLPINRAVDLETEMKSTATKELNEIFSTFSTIDIAKMYVKEYIAEAGLSLSKMAQISVFLNSGSLDSRQKLLQGRNITEQQRQAIIDNLSKKEVEFGQKILDYLDTLWADSKALSERTTGLAPEKVVAEEIQTKHGTFKGGYYPLKYDRRLSPRVKRPDLVTDLASITSHGGNVRATTKHGHRENRVKGVNLPVRLDFGVMFEHVSEVIHDQTHYEMLIDINRLLGSKRVQDAITDNHGIEVFDELRDSVKDVAAGDMPARHAFEKGLNWIRSGVSIAYMGWNMMTAVLQPFGLTQSMVRIGPKWVGLGLQKWLGDAVKLENTVKWIHSQSKLMRDRARTQNREINEIRNGLRLRGKVLDAIENSYFYFIAKAQMIADVPTWLGAYEKALSELNPENSTDKKDLKRIEERAVALADQAVIDSQGSGQIKDLAKIQRGSPAFKIWTSFYSFFSTTFNLTVESVKKTDFKSPKDIGRLGVDMLLLYTIPATLSFMARSALRGDEFDDDELMEALIRENLGYMTGTMIGVRELSGVVQGFNNYEGPAGTRGFAEAGKLLKQIEQGNADEAFVRSLNKTSGIFFHYPAGFVQKIIDGYIAIQEGETDNPAAMITGAPRK